MQSTSGKKENKSSTDSDTSEWREWLESVKTSNNGKVPATLGNSDKEERKSSADSDAEWSEWFKSVTSGNNKKDDSLPKQLSSPQNAAALKSLSIDYVQSLAGVAYTRLTHEQQVQLLQITTKRFEIWSQKRRLPSKRPPMSPNRVSPTTVGNRRHLSVPPASIAPPPSDILTVMEVECFLKEKANSGKCRIEKGSVWSDNLPPNSQSSLRYKHSAKELTSSPPRKRCASVGENNGEAPAAALDYSDEEVFDEEQGKSSTGNDTTG